MLMEHSDREILTNRQQMHNHLRAAALVTPHTAACGPPRHDWRVVRDASGNFVEVKLEEHRVSLHPSTCHLPLVSRLDMQPWIESLTQRELLRFQNAMEEDRVIQQGNGWVQEDTSDDLSSNSPEVEQDERANPEAEQDESVQLDRVVASPEFDGADSAGDPVPQGPGGYVTTARTRRGPRGSKRRNSTSD